MGHGVAATGHGVAAMGHGVAVMSSIMVEIKIYMYRDNAIDLDHGTNH